MHATKVQPFYLAVAFSGTVLLGPATAKAQCSASDQAIPATVPWDPSSPFRRLILIESQDCLGGSRDVGTLAVDVRKALNVPPDNAAFFKPAAESALVLIDIHLNTPIGSTSADVLRDVRRQVGQTRVLLGSDVSPALPTAWELDAGRIFAVTLPLQGYVDAACAAESAECTTAFETTKEVLRVARLTRSALLKYELPALKSLLAENLKREKSWDDYFERARSQYFWELALNSLLMRETRPEITPGVRGGFRAVPTSQILFLHPHVAMEYASEEAEGNKINPTVLMDVIGYNRWSWKADGSMGFAFGASFIISAADHVTTDDIALGFMVHVNHSMSAGLVFGSDKPTIVMSADAAKLWAKASEAAKTKIMAGK